MQSPFEYERRNVNLCQLQHLYAAIDLIKTKIPYPKTALVATGVFLEEAFRSAYNYLESEKIPANLISDHLLLGPAGKSVAVIAVSIFAGYLVNAGIKATSSVINAGFSLIDSFYSEPKWVKDKFHITLTNIFDKFRENKKFAEFNPNNVTDELSLLVSKIFQSENDNKTNPIDNHTEFLINLRAVIESPFFQTALKNKMNAASESSQHDQLVEIVTELCRIRFEEGYFYDFFEETLDMLGLKKDEGNKLSSDDFHKLANLNHEHKMCKTQTLLESAQGHYNIGFDPHLKGNIPYIVGTLNVGDKERKLMRIGSITMQKGMNKAEVIAEFKGYLTALLLQGKSHLYISLQNDIAKSYGGDERDRNRAIKDLQSEFKNFFAVVLAQDSPFYKQVDGHGKALGTQQSNEFLDHFYKEMFGENTGFYFPQSWKNDPVFTNNIRDLLKSVHTILFNKNDQYASVELSREEKLDFIEIFYSYLSVFLMDYSRTDNVNITCKDAIDRAGKMNSLILQLFLTIEGKANHERYQRVHQVLTHMPAMWVKGRPILGHRRGRLITAFNRMGDKMNKIQKNPPSMINPNQGVKFEIDSIAIKKKQETLTTNQCETVDA